MAICQSQLTSFQNAQSAQTQAAQVLLNAAGTLNNAFAAFNQALQSYINAESAAATAASNLFACLSAGGIGKPEK